MKHGVLVEQLSQFCIKIHYVRSKENVITDFMSRMYDLFVFDLVDSKLEIGLLERNIGLANLRKIPFVH